MRYGIQFRIRPIPISMFVLAIICSGALVLGCAQPRMIAEEVFESPTEFVLGPEDVLEITVWKNQDLSRTTVIRPDGLVSLPVIGDVPAAGLTTNALAENVSARLKQFVANPVVSVSVKDLNSYSIFVLGEVMKPGKYNLKTYTTLLQALSMAGGLTEYGRKNRMYVVRNRPNGDRRLHEIRIPVRYDDLVSGQEETGNFILKSGDTVVVP